jgi:hypothetical protein
MAARSDLIVRDVGSIANSLALTATAYEGLVQAITQRDLGLQEASVEIGNQSRLLSKSVAEVTERSVEAVTANKEASAVLNETGANIAQTLQRAAGALQENTTVLKGYGDQLHSATKAVLALSENATAARVNELNAMKSSLSETNEQAQSVIQRFDTLGQHMAASSEVLDRLSRDLKVDSASNATLIQSFNAELMATLTAQSNLLTEIKGSASTLSASTDPIVRNMGALQTTLERTGALASEILSVMNKSLEGNNGESSLAEAVIRELMTQHQATAEEFKILLRDVAQAMGAHPAGRSDAQPRRTPQAWMNKVFRG